MNSNQKQSIPPTGNVLLRKARIRMCFFAEWLVRPQPYAVHRVSAYIPCWSRFSLNSKRVCFSNAFEAHSAIARANVRQGEKVPVAQVAACGTGGHSSQGAGCRDLSHPPGRTVPIYRLHLHCQGIRHGGWESYGSCKPTPLGMALLLLSHTMALSSWHLGLGPFHCAAQTARRTSDPRTHSSRISLGRRNRDAGMERVPCSASNTLSAFLFPLQGKYPFFLSLFNSHTRVIYLQVVRLQK